MIKAAFKDKSCARCTSSEKKYGAPKKCQRCSLMSAFQKNKESQEKVGYFFSFSLTESLAGDC